MVDTSESLLGRLRASPAHEAWREFYDIYWGTVLRYARKLGLSAHQAEDVLQETMVTLMRILPGFTYDRGRGRFRNFLLTIVHRKCLATMRQNGRKTPATWSGSPFLSADGNAAAPHVLEAEAFRYWREAICDEALRRLRDSAALDSGTFAVFQAYVLQNRPAAEVARQFGLQENAVYQIKSRVLRRLQREVREMMRASGAE